MDPYVKVGSDLQLAVRYIMLSKKAFLKQSRCIKVLTKQKDLLQQKVEGLEMNNKELRALSLLTKRNVILKKQVSELMMSARDKREQFLNEILADDNTFALNEGATSQEGETSQEGTTTSSDANSTGDEEEVVARPLSPAKRKRNQSKDCDTPSVTKKKDKQQNYSQTGSVVVVDKDCDTPSVTKKKDKHQNYSQTGSVVVVEGNMTAMSPRRSTRCKNKRSDK